MQDRAGWTALQYASANNQVEIVRRLVQAEQATEPPSCGPCPPYTAAAESPPRDVDDSMQVDSIMPDIIPRHGSSPS
jgi:ankyrin repeat protein